MYTTINKKPGAWICTNDTKRQTRGRTKVYQPGSKIYLNDNEEFEIELYNPTNYNVKAEIKIDGKKISSGGLVIRSGQRAYLECFPDTNKKFTFKTYTVEDSNESREAIADNGRVEVEFYRERINYDYSWYNNWMGDTSGSYNCGMNTTLTSSINSRSFGNIDPNANNAYLSASLDSVNLNSEIETGQVDGGNDSDQQFEQVNMNFESWVLSSYTFQLLPMSQKPVEPKSFQTPKKKKQMIQKLEELEKLEGLRKNGTITHAEFKEMKAEIMG